MAFSIGVDIGGTFTDTTILNADGSCETFKTPTTSANPELGVLRGIVQGMAKAGVQPRECAELVISATVGLNSVIQRNGARVGLLVTEGFQDILEMGRVKMTDVFSLDEVRRPPLVPKDLVRGVEERIASSGRIIAPLDVGSLLAGARQLIDQGVESLALLFMHSYRNPVHEIEAKAILAQHVPDVAVAVSSEIWPQVREFERATVLVMNSYIAPKVNRYLTELANRKVEAALDAPIYVSASNGGLVPVSHALDKPVSTLLSGPSAGVVATLRLMKACEIERVITFDMGGTSADIAILEDDRIPYAWGQEIEGLPVAIPYVDISSIGSGGGSIAYVDNIGVLHVGPEGAGAEPGPAAYGRGGVRPTVTDAYLVCGFIDPDNFIGGGISLDLELARNAIRPLADKLGLSVEDTANGIIRVTTSVQVAEFSRLAAKKGIDYRRYTLVPFGGAGPTHACLLADELRIGKIIIPSTPGTFCALGSVLADFRLDYVKVEYSDLDKIRESEVDRWYGSVAREGRVTLSDVMDSVVELSVQKSVDVRYRGQGFEVSVPFDDLTEIPIRFREEYQKLYGSRQDDAAIEVTSFRATVVGHRTVPTLAVGRGNAPYPMPGSRDVFLTCEHLQVPVYRRADIGQGWSAAGPFIIDQADTTCVVTRGWTAAIDALGCLHLEKAH